MKPFTKDPDAVLDYRVDWSRWLADGDIIMDSEFIAPDGITLDADAHDTTSATCWLSGGTAGQFYNVVNRITTASGRTDDRTLRIWVQQR